MKILQQTLTGEEVKTLIENRMQSVTLNYNHAVANSDKIKAEIFAEVKWHLAELKMQLCDHLIEKLDQ